MTVVQHKLQGSTFERRPGWFTRLREWWMSTTAPVLDDWTEPVPVAARVEPKPTHQIQPPRPTHPQFAMQPAYSAHVLDRMLHLLVDLRGDSHMTATRALKALRPLNEELSGLVQQEFDQQRRMDRNQGVAVAQATLLEDAVRLGNDEDAVRQAAEGIAGRAVHVADPEPTGVMPRITEDMPDPRIVARPADVNPGDVEPAESPVRDGGQPAIPEPSSEFLAGEKLVPPQRREPEPLAHEVHAAGPTAVLPAQGAQTAVLPVVDEARDGD